MLHLLNETLCWHVRNLNAFVWKSEILFLKSCDCFCFCSSCCLPLTTSSCRELIMQFLTEWHVQIVCLIFCLNIPQSLLGCCQLVVCCLFEEIHWINFSSCSIHLLKINERKILVFKIIAVFKAANQQLSFYAVMWETGGKKSVTPLTTNIWASVE